MITFKISPPDDSFGFLKFGMPICEVIKLINSKYEKKDQNIQIRFDKNRLHSLDTVIDFKSEGVILRFTAMTQVLHKIVVYDPARCSLSFMESDFCQKEKVPTYSTIMKTFLGGDGSFDVKSSQYLHHYPGIIFIFNIEEQYREHFNQPKSNHEPINFPQGCDPFVVRMVFFQKNADEKMLRFNPSWLSNRTKGTRYFETVLPVPGVGLIFPRASKMGDETLNFGDGVQSLLMLLGNPERISPKIENPKMLALSGVTQNERGGMRSSSDGLGGDGSGGNEGENREGDYQPNDYFYIYGDLGIDFLIDGELHTIKKFVLHTNLPSHLLFGQYNRCNFAIGVSSSLHPAITFQSTWPEIMEKLGSPIRPPIVLDLTTQETHPPEHCGPSFYCGYKNLIFEITPEMLIATVYLYK
eukprot:CAMPEP_0201480980 /NCGR_PEP_ID=MMETSP0151_2-20130828/5330_1 /ASSEMBLY_ACC=CAM_ASM_000257 /TAXON_ID=200890 /ORGANISM="Paramoeba atlantica, Strain 621/1 / CCAP 1560/9" /LENGTH=411 /DNA_ID=CAMNT_0047862985 /DNA_START=86 /DNA_END=1321 /DNA_ORIENTATION=+